MYEFSKHLRFKISKKKLLFAALLTNIGARYFSALAQTFWWPSQKTYFKDTNLTAQNKTMQP